METYVIIIIVIVVLIIALVIGGLAYKKFVIDKAEEFKKRVAVVNRKHKEDYKRLQEKVAHVEKKAQLQAERFTRLAACPKSSGIKENYCNCSGDKCSCGKEGFRAKDAYAPAAGGIIPVRPMVNMVSGAVGKAKQLRAEQALRGAAAGLPMPSGSMLGKEAILTAGGRETFKPNRGMY